MNILSTRLLGFVLTLLLSTAAFAQFQDKTDVFAQAGAGDKMREYMFVVPEGCTITTPEGETISAGETLGIPGSLITLLTAEEADKEDAANSAFNDKGTYTDEEKAENIMISLRVPEGFTISHEDGRSVEGETDLKLVVEVDNLQASEPMTEAPSVFRPVGEM